MIISTSGRFSDSRPDRAAGARAQRLERLNVLADALGQLPAGQRGVAEEQHRLVLVPLQRADGEVAGVHGMAQQLVAHDTQIRTCYRIRFKGRGIGLDSKA